MKKLSVCIPTYEMYGLGGRYLSQSLDSLSRQTFTDFDIVISDHSRDSSIRDVCKAYMNRLDIHYVRNTQRMGNSSNNINSAIRNAKGQLIKILFQDDLLYSKDSLNIIVQNFDLKIDKWQLCACIHTKDNSNYFDKHFPVYNDEIHKGGNTVGSPSVLTLINDECLQFDEKLIWRMDGDYYKRCYQKFGAPKILNEICIINRIGPHQVSNTIVKEVLKELEYRYILNKYHEKDPLMNYIVRNIRRITKSIIQR